MYCSCMFVVCCFIVFFFCFVLFFFCFVCFFFQAEDGIRYLVRSRGLGDVYKRQRTDIARVLLREASGRIDLEAEQCELVLAQIGALERRASLQDLLRLRRLRHRIAKIMARL